MTSGAITDPHSIKASLHAEMYYREIRQRNSDIKIIANRTGISQQDIAKVKHYLFIAKHDFGNIFKQFDPSFHIAQSWQRLSDSHMKIQPHDVTLIKHELLEIKLIESGMSQSKAHIEASEIFDYKSEADSYYKMLGSKAHKSPKSS